AAERQRGLDDSEDLATPGEFSWTLSAPGDPAVWILRAGTTVEQQTAEDVLAFASHTRAAERRRRESFPSPLDRAADAYLVQRGQGRTIVAGYPWFTDWGRDTFIAIRGLCLATGQLSEARDILIEWAGAVSEGMLPSRFPDRGAAPEFNAIDASLWYVVAASELLRLNGHHGTGLSVPQQEALESAILHVVRGYAAGTRFGIRMDRVGKPEEVEALWVNALNVATELE